MPYPGPTLAVFLPSKPHPLPSEMQGGLSDAVERGWFRKRHSLFDTDFKSLILTAREVAAAMAYLHAKNVLHGDLTGGAGAGEQRCVCISGVHTCTPRTCCTGTSQVGRGLCISGVCEPLTHTTL